jgi:hypothetical protein
MTQIARDVASHAVNATARDTIHSFDQAFARGADDSYGAIRDFLVAHTNVVELTGETASRARRLMCATASGERAAISAAIVRDM